MRHQTLLTRSQWIALAVLLLFSLVPAAHASNILDDVGTTYYNASSAWQGSLFAIAKALFLKLALIEILWFAIWWTIERDDPQQFLVQLLRKIMGLLFFWAILVNFDTWIPAIIDGFAQAGQTAGGTGALTPSTVLDRGLEIGTKITATANEIGLLDGTAGLGKYLLAGLSALGIVLAFGVIAGQMLVTLIESYIVVNAGVLFLGFAGSRWTTTFAEKFISYAVSVGVKLFVTYLIIGAGQSISTGWSATLTSDMAAADYLTVLVGAVVYMFLAWQIPALASSMLTGAVSMTLGSAMASAGTMAAGALGAMGGMAAMGGGLTNGVAGAIKAGSAAIDQAKEGGATNMLSKAAGAGAALASAAGTAAKEGIQGLGSNSAGGSLANRINDKTASMREANAASSVSAPSVPGDGGGGGGGGGAPSTPTRDTPPAPTSTTPSTNSATPTATPTATTAAGTAAGTAATSETAAPSAAASEAGATTGEAAAPTATTSGVDAPTATSGTAPSGNAAAPSNSSTTNSQQPQKPEEGKGLLATLSSHAEAISQIPNDSAGSAGVQVNLKLD